MWARSTWLLWPHVRRRKNKSSGLLTTVALLRLTIERWAVLRLQGAGPSKKELPESHHRSGGWEMAGQRCPKRNRRSRNAKVLRRAVVGLIASAGAFLAFGMTPLAMTPSAHADEFDLIIDPIINSLASVDPTLAVDMTGWLANLDSALAAASSVDASSLAGAAATAESTSLGALSTDVSSASAANPSDTFVQGLEQDWMNSSLGQQVDSSLNEWFNQADPAQVNPAADPTAGACGL